MCVTFSISISNPLIPPFRPPSFSLALQAVRLLALYEASPEQREAVMATLQVGREGREKGGREGGTENLCHREETCTSLQTPCLPPSMPTSTIPLLLLPPPCRPWLPPSVRLTLPSLPPSLPQCLPEQGRDRLLFLPPDHGRHHLFEGGSYQTFTPIPPSLPPSLPPSPPDPPQRCRDRLLSLPPDHRCYYLPEGGVGEGGLAGCAQRSDP